MGGKMKTILALALAALAAAEPEANADPYYYGGYGLGYGHGLYGGYRHTVLDTAVVGMARGRLRLSPRLMPIPTTTEDTDMVATELTVSDTDTVSDTAVVSTATARGRLSPTTESTLPTTPLPLS